ncbi:MAG: 50S ribosomal protein L9 [Candidatus Electryonea clarkiae]|nr:50S ribosomal protein L9 [Candidatus Electryonea clarkiae]MDP8287578.1 50S ribosomal protein L9 [Candidatus Electryonea clarkiae]
MKIILRETFENLGRTGDVVEVKNGYARNYLVPSGIAYPENKFYRRLFDSEREELLRKDGIARVQAEETAGKAAGIEISFTVKIGDRGKMFGAITNTDIATRLQEQGIDIDRRKIGLKEPIKTTGSHHIPVKLHGEVGFNVKVDIIPEAPLEDEMEDDEESALAGAEETPAVDEAVWDAEAPDTGEEVVTDAPQIVELVEVMPVITDESEENI